MTVPFKMYYCNTLVRLYEPVIAARASSTSMFARSSALWNMLITCEKAVELYLSLTPSQHVIQPITTISSVGPALMSMIRLVLLDFGMSAFAPGVITDFARGWDSAAARKRFDVIGLVHSLADSLDGIDEAAKRDGRRVRVTGAGTPAMATGAEKVRWVGTWLRNKLQVESMTSESRGGDDEGGSVGEREREGETKQTTRRGELRVGTRTPAGVGTIPSRTSVPAESLDDEQQTLPQQQRQQQQQTHHPERPTMQQSSLSPHQQQRQAIGTQQDESVDLLGQQQHQHRQQYHHQHQHQHQFRPQQPHANNGMFAPLHQQVSPSGTQSLPSPFPPQSLSQPPLSSNNHNVVTPTTYPAAIAIPYSDSVTGSSSNNNNNNNNSNNNNNNNNDNTQFNNTLQYPYLGYPANNLMTSATTHDHPEDSSNGFNIEPSAYLDTSLSWFQGTGDVGNVMDQCLFNRLMEDVMMGLPQSQHHYGF